MVSKSVGLPVSPETLYPSFTTPVAVSRYPTTQIWKSSQDPSVSAENSHLASPLITFTLKLNTVFINVSLEDYDEGKGPYPQVVVQGLDTASLLGLQVVQDGRSRRHINGAANHLRVAGSVARCVAEGVQVSVAEGVQVSANRAAAHSAATHNLGTGYRMDVHRD